MKKVLFAGALAACMALSSAAFAAESFGTTGITGTYDKQAGTVSVTTIPETLTTGADQLTLVILDGDIETSASITKEMIQYIDQDSKSATDLFKGMGLLDGLTVGKTYTLRIGSDNNAAFAEAKFTVVADAQQTRTIRFVFGDVNSTYTEGAAIRDLIKPADAMDVLTIASGSTTYNVGGAYPIGTVVTDKDGKTFMFGDVNSTYAEGSAIRDLIKPADAMDILTIASGSTTYNVGGAYPIGTVVSVEVPVE